MFVEGERQTNDAFETSSSGNGIEGNRLVAAFMIARTGRTPSKLCGLNANTRLQPLKRSERDEPSSA